MLIWSIVLFCLGVLAVLDSQFNYGYVFRSANSVAFMLISLGLLIRIRVLKKSGFIERNWEPNKKPSSKTEALLQARMAKKKQQQDVSV